MVNCLRLTPLGSALAAAFPALKPPDRPRSQEKEAVFSPSPSLKALARGMALKSCLMYPVLSGVSRRESQLLAPVDGPKTNEPPEQYFAPSAAVIGTKAFEASS